MSHSLFIIHKIACRMLAARKQNQLDRTVRRANEHEIYRICVCVFVPLPKTCVSCTGHTHDSILSPLCLLRTEQTKRENILVHTLNGEMFFNTFSAAFLLRTPILFFFSFGRALACSWYLNSFQFVILFPFFVFFFAVTICSAFLITGFLWLSNSSPDTKLSYLSTSKLILTQTTERYLYDSF